MRNKKIARIIVFVIAFIMLVGTFASMNVYGATTKVTYKGAVSSLGTTVGKFEVKEKNAFCAQHSKASPPTGTTVKSIKKVTSVKMRKALYYGYGGPEAKVKKTNAGWVKTSVALSLANGYSAGTASAKSLYNKLGDYATPPPSFTVYYCDTANNKQDLCYWVYEPEGKLRVKKATTDTSALASNGYSLEGAVYGVYEKKTCTSASRVAKLTTKENGYSSYVTLDAGTYYVKEISAPEGYSVSSTVYTAKITDQSEVTKTVKDAPKKGKLQLIKSSAKPEVTNGNSGYSLAGAKYGVYSDSGLTNRVGVLTTTSNGSSNTLSLYADTYYVKELTAPLGYEKDPTKYSVKISVDSLSTVEILKVKDDPIDDPFALVLKKVDATTKEPVPTGDGELEGAIYTLKYYSGTPQSTDPAKDGKSPTREWKFKTDSQGYIFLDDEYFVSGNDLYYGTFGTPVLYKGTLTVQEESAPIGYNINETIYTLPISEDGMNSVITDNAPTTPETPITGDIQINKTDSKTGEPLGGVVFNIIDKTENRVVATLTTDENGHATTKVDGANKGSLVYGTYIVRETEPLIGYNSVKDIEVNINDDLEIVKLDIKNDKAEIKTSALNGETNSRKAFSTDAATIIDTVSFKNLIEDTEYILNGILMVKETGEPLLVDGNPVTVTKKFEPTTSNGTTTVEFEFDATGLEGKTIVVFEELYLDETKIAEHSDINDEEQSIEFVNPKVKTTAICTDTNSNLGIAKEDSEFIDTVKYDDIIPNLNYTLISYLVDKESGLILGEVIEESTDDGSEGEEGETTEDGEYDEDLDLGDTENAFEDVYKEQTFTPTSSNGEIEVKFNIDARNLTGRELVIYEEIYTENGILIASHKDINDADQTITFINPKIGTLAYVKGTKEHITFAKDSVTIIDSVDYTGLAPNVEFILDAIVMDKDTGEPLLVNGEQITKNITFTPTEETGVKNVELTFDASGLKNKSIVIFEKLYFKDVELAKHEDINDEGQTVHFPSIKTTLIDADTNSHISKSNTKDELIDIVEYENLIPRHEYEFESILHDKDTGNHILVDGKEVTVTTKFIPSKANGKEEIVFKLDTTQLEGKTVVAFETLLLDSVEITNHKDINDEKQSVSIPKVSTSAKDSKTMKRVAFAEKETTLIDTAKYSEVLKDEEYEFVGTLIDEESGKAIEENGEPIVVRKTFNSTDTAGEVELRFNFDSRDYLGKNVVIFEELYHNGNLIGEHKDITDVNQTIYFPEIATIAEDKITGAHISYANGSASVIDTVGYRNLITDEECMLQGILMDAATSEPILVNGEQVTSEKTFTSEEEGEVQLEFNLDATDLQNVTAVVFETLYVDGKKVAEHKDITDENQSIHFPKIKTQLTNITTQNHIAFANGETVLLDTVSFENLVPKLKYVLTGILMDAETGEPIIIDGETATSSIEFKPDEPNGTAEVKFDFDYSQLEGKTVVAFETLSYEGNVIAEHKDITDKEQSVTFPKIRTMAIDSETKCHISYADNEVTVTDTVDYYGLNVDDEYVIKGIVMNKYAESPIIINNESVTSEFTFVPETTDGQVELTFKFDAETLAGDTIVIFEEVYFDGHIIAEHKDFNDENQTIHFPRIETYAKDKETGNQTITYEKGKINIIVDMIKYDNLLTENEYVGKGILMEQQTGEPIQTNGELVEGEVKFTPTETTGIVEVEFSIDAADYKNSAVVVFEELYLDGNIIASHKDINDKSQTIKFYDEPKTGNDFNYLILIGIVVAMLSGTITVFVRRKNDKQTNI